MAKTFKDSIYEQLEVLREIRRDREITLWELFLSLVDGKEERYVLALKADIRILERIAMGMSPSYIAGIMGIPTQDVTDVANIWGFKPLNFTLDFNPLFIYEQGMTPDAFMAEINEVLAIPIGLDTARQVVYNIGQLRIAKSFLEDVDGQ